MSRAKRLREVLSRPGITMAPGAYDAFSARLIQDAGFDVCYMTGNGSVASMLGRADIGLATATEMIGHAGNIAAAIDIPLICDADTGYGNVNNVRRTVEMFEQAGIAGIHIEDQVTPKKCGAMEGVQVIPLEETVRKIEAALKARKNKDFMIIARTDARSVCGLEEAITRAKAFSEVGADMVYVEMLESEAEIAQVTGAVDKPVVYDMFEVSRERIISASRLEQLGCKLVIFPISSILLAGGAIRQLLLTLKETGTTASFYDKMLSLKEYEQLLGLDAEQQWSDHLKG